MSQKLLEFEDIVCGYADTMVVRGVSGQVAQGKVLGIVGRNGVGKSTLMKGLAGFLPIAGGRVRIRGRGLGALASYARPQAGIVYAPQENMVFGELRVEENLWLHLPDRNAQRYAAALSAFPRLTERLQQRAGLLSGGERKLLSFTRTLGLQASVSLLDEPTEGVQPENIDRMASLVKNANEAGRSFVIVEQNLTFIEQVADEVMVLDHGKVVLSVPMAGLGRESIERHLVV